MIVKKGGYRPIFGPKNNVPPSERKIELCEHANTLNPGCDCFSEPMCWCLDCGALRLPSKGWVSPGITQDQLCTIINLKHDELLPVRSDFVVNRENE